MHAWKIESISPFVQRFFEVAGELPTDQLEPAQWRGLNLVWVVFMVSLGGLNLYVAYSFSEDFWVKFKVFGLMGITFVFLIAQSAWLVSRLDLAEEHESDGEQ